MLVVRPVGLKRLACLACDVLHTLADQVARLGVEHQIEAQRAGRTLAGVVVRRGTNAAERKNHVATGKRRGQRGGDALRVVAYIVRIRHLQATRAQNADGLRQVLVGALAREDFVANDDQTKVHKFPKGKPGGFGACSTARASASMTKPVRKSGALAWLRSACSASRQKCTNHSDEKTKIRV